LEMKIPQIQTSRKIQYILNFMKEKNGGILIKKISRSKHPSI
jgi:hypothetical protein